MVEKNKIPIGTTGPVHGTWVYPALSNYDLFIFWTAASLQCYLCNYWVGNSISLRQKCNLEFGCPHLTFVITFFLAENISVSHFTGESPSRLSIREKNKEVEKHTFLRLLNGLMAHALWMFTMKMKDFLYFSIFKQYCLGFFFSPAKMYLLEVKTKTWIENFFQQKIPSLAIQSLANVGNTTQCIFIAFY